MLIAVNLAGNLRRRPAGSGFWAASVDEDECGAPFAGIFGCRFDSDGVDTRCGLVHVDSKIERHHDRDGSEVRVTAITTNADGITSS